MIVDRQTHRQTDTLITILRSPIGGGVINVTRLSTRCTFIEIIWASHQALVYVTWVM